MSLFPHNATLIFDVPTGAIVIDPKTGNRIPTEKSLIVKASLKAAKSNFNEIPAGIDPMSVYVDGRSLTPKFLPATIKAGMRAQCTIVDLATKQKQTGQFVLSPIVPSRWKPVTKTLGSKLIGYFIQSGDD